MVPIRRSSQKKNLKRLSSVRQSRVKTLAIQISSNINMLEFPPTKNDALQNTDKSVFMNLSGLVKYLIFNVF
jgi:hypothetical protein